GLGAQVFLVDDAVVADDEGRDARKEVLRRRRNKREAADHRALHDEVHLAERRRRALPLQDFEEVAVVGNCFLGVALLDGLGDVLADGPAPRAVWILPRQAVLLAWFADDALRVLIDPGALVHHEGVLMLRLNISTADLDCIELVAADGSIEDLLSAGRRIEAPLSGLPDDRDRKRPILIADDDGR